MRHHSLKPVPGNCVKESEVQDIIKMMGLRDRDEFADILRAGYGAIIKEADEYRPLADYIIGLIKGFKLRSEKAYDALYGDSISDLDSDE